MSENKNIDERDRKILEELCRNSRISYSELAKKLGISDVAIIKRIRKLEETGVIKKYTIVVDPSKLGYKSISFTGINVDPQKLFNVIEELKGMDEIKYLALTSGDHHLIAVIWCSDQDELREIHRRISMIDGVERIYPSILINKLKGDLCI